MSFNPIIKHRREEGEERAKVYICNQKIDRARMVGATKSVGKGLGWFTVLTSALLCSLKLCQLLESGQNVGSLVEQSLVFNPPDGFSNLENRPYLCFEAYTDRICSYFCDSNVTSGKGFHVMPGEKTSLSGTKGSVLTTTTTSTNSHFSESAETTEQEIATDQGPEYSMYEF